MLIHNRADLIASLDDEFAGVLADHDSPNVAALGFALGKHLGVLDADTFDEATRSAAAAFDGVMGEADHIVFLLLDGFGMNFVETLPEDSWVRKHTALTLCSTLPTSTGPNLMALATGRWPGTHGNLGWWVHIPRLGERIEPLPWTLARTGQPLHEVGFRPSETLLAPMIPFGDQGSFTVVMGEHLVASTTTRMYGAFHYRGYPKAASSTSHIVEHVLDAIAMAPGKSFTYVYWSEVDDAAHKHGETHPVTRAAVLRAAALVEVLATALTGKARLLAAADHGHLDSPDEVWTPLTPSAPLSRHLICVPAGEPRALFFHAKPGAAERFQDLFDAELSDRFTLMRSEDAIAMGLFGPVGFISDAARARMGDFFALSRGRWCIHASDTEEEETQQSMHGGITTAESIVPLIVV